MDKYNTQIDDDDVFMVSDDLKFCFCVFWFTLNVLFVFDFLVSSKRRLIYHSNLQSRGHRLRETEVKVINISRLEMFGCASSQPHNSEHLSWLWVGDYSKQQAKMSPILIAADNNFWIRSIQFQNH